MKTNRIFIPLIALCCFIQQPCSAPIGREAVVTRDPALSEQRRLTAEHQKTMEEIERIKREEPENQIKLREAQRRAEDIRKVLEEADKAREFFPAENGLIKNIGKALKELGENEKLVLEDQKRRAMGKEPFFEGAVRREISIILRFLQDIKTEDYAKVSIEDRLKIADVLLSQNLEQARRADVIAKILKSIDLEELKKISKSDRLREEFNATLKNLWELSRRVPAEEVKKLTDLAFSFLSELNGDSSISVRFIGDFALGFLEFTSSITDLSGKNMITLMETIDTLLSEKEPEKVSQIVEILLNKIVKGRKGGPVEKGAADRIGSYLLSKLLKDTGLLKSLTDEQISSLGYLYGDKIIEELPKAAHAILSTKDYVAFQKLTNILPHLFDKIDADTLSSWQKALIGTDKAVVNARNALALAKARYAIEPFEKVAYSQYNNPKFKSTGPESMAQAVREFFDKPAWKAGVNIADIKALVETIQQERTAMTKHEFSPAMTMSEFSMMRQHEEAADLTLNLFLSHVLETLLTNPETLKALDERTLAGITNRLSGSDFAEAYPLAQLLLDINLIDQSSGKLYLGLAKDLASDRAYFERAYPILAEMEQRIKTARAEQPEDSHYHELLSRPSMTYGILSNALDEASKKFKAEDAAKQAARKK